MTATPPRRPWTTRVRSTVARGREIRAQSRYQFHRHLPDLLHAVLPGPVWALFPHRVVGVVVGQVAFEPIVNAGRLTRLGNYSIVGDGLDTSSIIYSVGLGGNASFDAEAASRLGCAVHVFDPTPGVIPFGERLAAEHPTVTFHPEAMWLTAGELPMFGHPAPNRSTMKFGSLADTEWGDQEVRVPAVTYSGTLDALGHDRVDLLKADIEGGALPLVGAVLRTDRAPAQIAAEFEVPRRLLDLLSFAGEVLRVVRRAEAQGYGCYLLTHKRGRGLEVLFHRRTD